MLEYLFLFLALLCLAIIYLVPVEYKPSIKVQTWLALGMLLSIGFISEGKRFFLSTCCVILVYGAQILRSKKTEIKKKLKNANKIDKIEE